MPGPFRVIAASGGAVAFPTQGGQPVCVTREEFEACCCRPLPIICDGMPAGDCVFEITKAEYRAWASAGTWRLSFTAVGGESFNGGLDGGLYVTAPEGVTADLASSLGCEFSDTFSGLPITTYYYGSTFGWPPFPGTANPGTVSVTATINLGISSGRYYAGVTLSIYAGGAVADSGLTPTPGKEGNGNFPATVGGHVIPMQPRLSLFYTESLGAENTIVWTTDLVRV